MGSITGVSSTSAISIFNAKAAAFETTLRQTLETFKELILNAVQIQHELEICETELLSQKQKCERKLCSSSKIYEKIIESKNNIIQLAVSSAIRIDETKNLSMLSELLKILCGDIEMLTPPKQAQNNKENVARPDLSPPNKHKLPMQTKSNSPINKKKCNSPKKELNTSLKDVSFRDDSVSEIEGTPGRTSPIIHLKKLKSCSSISSPGTSTELRDKKKCPNNWNTSEAKQIKLSYPSPKSVGKGKALRQSRLSIVYSKQSSVVDLTCSPELAGDSANSQNPPGHDQNANVVSQNPQIQILLKKEPSENDDTILPSPTSGPTNIASLRTASKDNKNFKKPLSYSRVKAEDSNEVNSPIIQFVERKCKNTTIETDLASLEDSINILKSNRFAKSPHKQIKQESSPAKTKQSPQKRITSAQSPQKRIASAQSPVKTDQLVRVEHAPMDCDVTHCEESSMSILQHVNKLEIAQNSPSKIPLGENQNVVNVPADRGSISPARDIGTTRVAKQEHQKRKVYENVEPVYKEPTVRKKAEKLALPAWCCDECKSFFGDLYDDDDDKFKAVIARCSKHRGRNNPSRPRTPPGFWDPRWEVPSDTEEFNRRNNAH